MTFKTKKIFHIFAVAIVALASVASSFFVSPPKLAQAVDCADPGENNGQGGSLEAYVLLSKPKIHAGEKLRWYAQYVLPDGTTGGDALSPQPCKDVQVNFWLVVGRGGRQNIKYKAIWDDQINGFKGGGEFVTAISEEEMVSLRGGSSLEMSLRIYVEEEGDNINPVACATTTCTGQSIANAYNSYQVVPDSTDVSAVNDPVPPVLDSDVLSGSDNITPGRNLQQSDIKPSVKTAETFGININQDLKMWYEMSWESGTISPPPLFETDTLNVNTKVVNPIGDPTLYALYIGINFPGSKMDCLGGNAAPDTWTETNCEQGIINDDNFDYLQTIPSGRKEITLPYSIFAEKVTTAPTAGNPVTVQLSFFPVVSLDYNDALVAALTTACKVNGTLTGLETLLGSLVGVTCDDFLNADKAYSNQAKTFNVKVYAEGDTVPEEEINGVGEVVSTGTGTTSSVDGKDGGTGLVNFIADLIFAFVGFLNQLIYAIFGGIILPLLATLLNIRTYTDAFAAVILPGWELLRNLANIFFIVVLLVIGLATLFRVQKYQYKSLLVNLIFAALLVNFSLVITQSVLAVAETVQNQFLPSGDGTQEEQDAQIAIKVIANRLIIAPINQEKVTPPDFEAKAKLSSAFGRLVLPIFYLSLAIMAFVVFVFLVFFVLIRLLVIWILLMTSPIAFVAWILPDTKKWSSKWLDNLLRYAFFVAILGFFLNIAAYVAQKQQGVLNGLYASAGDSGFANFLSIIATNFFVMGFLIAGVIFAQGSGVIGAKAFGKYAKMGGMLPFKALGKGLGGIGSLAKAGAERGFEGVQNKTGVTVDPREWKKGYQSYMKSRAEEREKRIKKRKMGDSFIGNKFGKGVGSALGSPEQFLENFGSPAGWKTMGKKITGSKWKWLGNDARGEKDRAQKRAENIKDIKTEDDRHALSQKIQDLLAEQVRGVKVTSKTEGVKDILDQLKKEKSSLDGQVGLAGNPDEERDVKKRAADLQKVIDEIEAGSRELTDSAVIDDISAATNAGVAKVIKDKVTEITDRLEGERPNHKDEIDELRAQETADDAARVANGFSAFNDNPPADGTYKKFDAGAKGQVDIAAHAAARAVDEMDFKQLIKASAETAKEQAKIMSEYKERGLGEDASALIAEMESSRGKKDFKDRQDVLWQLAAANGHTGALLDYHGKDKNGKGFLELMQKEYKVMDANNQINKDNLKKMNSVLQKMDEFHKRNGEHAYGYMTQRAGAQVVTRSAESQAAAFQNAIANMNTAAFLRSPEANFFNITNVNGKTERTLTDGARKRFEAMDPSEANQVIANLPPAMRKKLVDSKGFNDVKWKIRSDKDNKKGAKYKSIEEAIRKTT